MDWQQQTCGKWTARRDGKNIEPAISSSSHRRVDTALKNESLYNLLIIDGRPATDQDSILIAKSSSLVVLLTGTSLDDLMRVVYMNKTKVKIAPPQTLTQSVTETPASSKASSSEETKNIQFKVTPNKHIEIKAFSAERGLSLKEFFLKLYENEFVGMK